MIGKHLRDKTAGNRRMGTLAHLKCNKCRATVIAALTDPVERQCSWLSNLISMLFVGIIGA